MSTPLPAPDRHMLRRHIADLGLAALDQTYRRFAADPVAATSWTRAQFRAYHGDLHESLGGPLHARTVSRGEGPGFRYENVLFESHPGWEVNATLYLPATGEGPFPPVVVSVGHSGKQFVNYQFPCHYFARAGFAAIIFDPPGMAGEKQPGNDHFDDGVRCHLTGDTSGRYFVGDTLRAMDYLATRADIDIRHGFACTGVSGGGHSSIYAALLDDRVTAVAPSCCVTRMGSIMYERNYSCCPETMMQGRLRDGLDDAHLLGAIAPRPLLLLYGQGDEVFHAEDTRQAAADVRTYYAAQGAAEQFSAFEDTCGHAYTLAQAREFCLWLQRVWQLPAGALPSDDPKDYALLPVESISCHPNQQVNMRSLTRRRADDLAAQHAAPTVERLRAQAQLDPATPAPQPVALNAGQRTWFHDWREWVFASEPGITVPVSTVTCPDATATLWHLDPAGRLTLAQRGGLLMQAIGHLDRNGPQANLLAADLRGWGETAPATSPYENVSWGSPDRTLGYVGISLDAAVETGRIRDAWQLQRTWPVQPRTVLHAVGAAGPVALHLAALTRAFSAVVLHDAPASYADLLATAELAWPHDLILPGVLRHYDLPLLATTTGCPVHWLNPRDGAGQPLPADECARRHRPGVHWHHGVDADAHLALLRKLLYTNLP